jgi:hypothetical protein
MDGLDIVELSASLRLRWMPNASSANLRSEMSFTVAQYDGGPPLATGFKMVSTLTHNGLPPASDHAYHAQFSWILPSEMAR